MEKNGEKPKKSFEQKFEDVIDFLSPGEQEKTKKGFWRELGEAFPYFLRQGFLLLAGFVIGIGILVLLGQKDILKQWDSEVVILLGLLALLAAAGIVMAVVALVKKKK